MNKLLDEKSRMKTFRRGYFRSGDFYAILPTIIVTPILCYMLSLEDRYPTWPLWLPPAFLVLVVILDLLRCNYVTITDTEIAFIHPYLRKYKEVRFEDITRVKFYLASRAMMKVMVWTRDGERFSKGLGLVRWQDIDNLVDIFISHGIEVDKYWKDKLKY